MSTGTKKNLSVVCWGQDSFLLNTPGYSYLYPMSSLTAMEEIAKHNQGLWQLNLLIDLSRMARRYIGSPISYRPQSHLWGFDGLIRGEVVVEMTHLFTRLPRKLNVEVDAPTFANVWYSHMRGRVGDMADPAPAAPGGSLGGNSFGGEAGGRVA